MKIGIMAAMPEEVAGIRANLTGANELTLGGRSYFSGDLHGHSVVLVFSNWGKVAAATTATALILHFKIDRLIFMGVAGALAPELNVGDVVIAEQLYQHDMDARPLFPRYEIPLTEITYFRADLNLTQHARAAVVHLFKSLTKQLSIELLQQFNISMPNLYCGLIATGDQFVNNNIQRLDILAAQPRALAIEMEGAAVAQVCHDYAIPQVIIRTISDKADATAPVDFAKFLHLIAGHYAAVIVIHMLMNMT